MIPGRVPKPTAVLKLSGSRRANSRKGEPQPLAGVPECPAWLDDEARACWAEVTEQLAAMGILSLADGRLLVRYCQAWSRWRAAEAVLQREGSTQIVGKAGYIAPRPEVAEAAKLAILLTSLEDRMGLSPSARTRIRVPEKRKPKDGKGRFFKAD